MYTEIYYSMRKTYACKSIVTLEKQTTNRLLRCKLPLWTCGTFIFTGIVVILLEFECAKLFSRLVRIFSRLAKLCALDKLKFRLNQILFVDSLIRIMWTTL